MPLHPVPLIIGTTIALIGSSYAFKKWIYDTHLAHYVEAILAHPSLQHLRDDYLPLHDDVPNSTHPAPVAIHVQSGIPDYSPDVHPHGTSTYEAEWALSTDASDMGTGRSVRSRDREFLLSDPLASPPHHPYHPRQSHRSSRNEDSHRWDPTYHNEDENVGRNQYRGNICTSSGALEQRSCGRWVGNTTARERRSAGLRRRGHGHGHSHTSSQAHDDGFSHEKSPNGHPFPHGQLHGHGNSSGGQSAPARQRWFSTRGSTASPPYRRGSHDRQLEIDEWYGNSSPAADIIGTHSRKDCAEWKSTPQGNDTNYELNQNTKMSTNISHRTRDHEPLQPRSQARSQSPARLLPHPFIHEKHSLELEADHELDPASREAKLTALDWLAGTGFSKRDPRYLLDRENGDRESTSMQGRQLASKDPDLISQIEGTCPENSANFVEANLVVHPYSPYHNPLSRSPLPYSSRDRRAREIDRPLADVIFDSSDISPSLPTQQGTFAHPVATLNPTRFEIQMQDTVAPTHLISEKVENHLGPVPSEIGKIDGVMSNSSGHWSESDLDALKTDSANNDRRRDEGSSNQQYEGHFDIHEGAAIISNFQSESDVEVSEVVEDEDHVENEDEGESTADELQLDDEEDVFDSGLGDYPAANIVPRPIARQHCAIVPEWTADGATLVTSGTSSPVSICLPCGRLISPFIHTPEQVDEDGATVSKDDRASRAPTGWNLPSLSPTVRASDNVEIESGIDAEEVVNTETDIVDAEGYESATSVSVVDVSRPGSVAGWTDAGGASDDDWEAVSEMGRSWLL